MGVYHFDMPSICSWQRYKHIPHGFFPVLDAVNHDLPDHVQWLTSNNLHALIIHDSIDPAVNMRQCTDPALDNQGKNLNTWMIRFLASKTFVSKPMFKWTKSPIIHNGG